MNDKNSLWLLLLLIGWLWWIKKPAQAASSVSTASAAGVNPGGLIGAVGNAVQAAVQTTGDAGSAILNAGSNTTASIIMGIKQSGGAGSSGTSGAGNLPAVQGGAAPIVVLGPGTTTDANPVNPGQPGYTPINANSPVPVDKIVFIPSGAGDAWQGGYDLVTYADGSQDFLQHHHGAFPLNLYQPLLDSSGNPVPQTIP